MNSLRCKSGISDLPDFHPKSVIQVVFSLIPGPPGEICGLT